MISQHVSSVSRRRVQDLRQKKREVSTREAALFEECLDRVHDGALKTELADLIRVITREGERLTHYRSLDQLDFYKGKVRDFVAKAHRKTFRVKATGFTEASGDYATHLIVERVDTALEQLTQLVMNKETTTLQILARLDLIKGLLTDLYQ